MRYLICDLFLKLREFENGAFGIDNAWVFRDFHKSSGDTIRYQFNPN